MFSINSLDVFLDEKQILDSVDLKVKKGEIILLMGSNGSGKSTLGKAIMGHPRYKTKGSIKLNEEEVNNLKTNKRAEKGIFLAFQEPAKIKGVNLLKVLSKTKKDKDLFKLKNELEKRSKEVGLNKEFINNEMNVGFSGGEKKRMELIQMDYLDPKLIIIDEMDSGMDIDGIKILSKKINELKKNGKSIIVITHQTKLIEDINFDKVYLMKKGRIICEGGKELIEKIEKEGYNGC